MKTCSASLTLCALAALPLSAAIVVDGTLDGSSTLRAIQTVETGFGDNQSEWNAGYGDIAGGALELMLTGNLQDNFNKLEIFIDSLAGGSNVYNGPTTDGANIMNGMVFDTAFTPEYHIIARRGSFGGDKFDLSLLNLTVPSGVEDFDVFGGTSSGSGFGANTGITVAYDGSNVAGIGGTAGAAANQADALAVTTGLELSIPLSAIGSPATPVRVTVVQNGDGHNFLSNQILGGLPVGSGNLGTDGNGNFVGGSNVTVDFSAIAGDQFFVIPEPSASLLGLLGALLLLRRRR